MDADRRAKKRAFLASFRVTGNITLAAEASEICRQSHYEWLKDDPEYVDAFKHAGDEAADKLEQEARRRALEGVRRPVLHQGVQVQILNPDTGQMEPLFEHQYSDVLTIFLLKGARPEKFRDNVSVKQDIDANVNHTIGGDIPGWFRKNADGGE